MNSLLIENCIRIMGNGKIGIFEGDNDITEHRLIRKCSLQAAAFHSAFKIKVTDDGLHSLRCESIDTRLETAVFESVAKQYLIMSLVALSVMWRVTKSVPNE